MGIKSITEFYAELMPKLGVTSEEEMVQSLKDYFIIEREVPGTINVHSANIVNVGDKLLIEISKELYQLAEGKPDYTFTTEMSDYQQLITGNIDLETFLENLKIYAHGKKS